MDLKNMSCSSTRFVLVLSWKNLLAYGKIFRIFYPKEILFNIKL